MTKSIRITAANGTVKNVALSARVKLEPPFIGAKIEIVDNATGALLSGVKSKIVGKNLILSFTEDGKKQVVTVEEAAASSSSSEQSGAEVASSNGRGANVSTQPDGPLVKLGDAEGADHSGGFSGGAIGLGLAGLGAVGGLVAALGKSKDTTPPAAPTGLDLAAADDSGSNNADDVTNQTSALTITGQAEANARVELFEGTTSLGATTASATGAFSLDVTLAAGARSITAKATDTAGNIGAASAALAVTVDATPPAAPTGLDLAAADDSGSNNADDVTNQTSALTITGQAEANARVELFDGTTSLGTTTASATGAFSLEITLAAGAHSITAKATDAAGNVGAASAALAVTVDATPPAAPTGLDLAAADDSGSNNADNITNQTSALTITGQAEANARVELFDGASSLGTTTASATGAFSLDVTLAAGAHSITAKATDAAGNVGAAATALAVTVDATPPAGPTGLDLAAADDSGSNNADDVTNQTSALTITGQAEANARVELFDGTTSLGATTASATGAFSLDVTLAAGARSITAKATDAAGNVGAASTALAVTVDAAPPAATLLEVNRAAQTLTIRFDEGIDPADNLPASVFSVKMGSGAVNSVTNVTVNGSTVVLTLADAIVSGNTVVTYTDPSSGNDAVAVQDTADNDAGSFTLSLGVVADGFVRGARIFVETVVAGKVVRTDTGVVTDAEGNFFLPPAFVGGTIVAVGGVNVDTGIANTIEYKAPAGSTVINPLTTLIQAVIDASPTPISSAAASQSVANALGVVLPDGKLLTNYDPISFGNTEVQRAAAQVAAIVTIVDTNAAGDETKVFANIATKLVTAANSNSTVDLASSQLVADAVKGTKAADSAGLVEEIRSSVTAIGNATNIAQISQAQGAALDKVAAATPGQIDLRAADDTGASNSDNITSKKSFSGTISFNNTATDGTAVVVGDTVEVVVGGQVLGSRVVTRADLVAGFVTVAFENVNDGAYSASARIVDKAGNISELSTPLNITVDSTKPATPTLSFSNLIDTGSSEQAPVTSDKSFNIGLSGAENGAVVVYEVSTDGGTSWTATNVNQSNLADGSYQFRATVTDVAGNSVASNIVSMTVDTTNPSTPLVPAQSSTSTSPVVSGTAVLAAGEVLSVSINGAIYENIAVTNGAWSINTASATPKPGTTLGAFANGSYEVVATIVDRAGNVSTDASTRELTVTPTFSVSESNGVVSFAGTATGVISISYNENGEAVFSRSGVSAATTIASLGTKSIAGVVELNVDITGIATAADDIITISAAEATAIRFSGDAGAGVDQLVVKVADKNVGTFETRTILVDTSGITNAENIRFAFDATAANDPANALDNDRLVLASGSVISSGFTVFEVRNGTVDYRAASLPKNVNFDFASGGVSTLAQFRDAGAFVSLVDSGSIVIALTSAELPALQSFLASPGALKLIGFTVGLEIDGGEIINLSTTTDKAYASLNAALDAISYPGIVGLTTAVNDLQSQIEANNEDIANLVSGIGDLSSSISTLNNAVISKDAAQTAALNTATSVLGKAITDAITALEIKLKDGVSADLDTFKEVATRLGLVGSAIGTLNANDTTNGSVAKSVKTAFDTLTTNYGLAITGAINTLEGKLKDGVSTDLDTFKEVATKLGALQSAINTLNGTGAGSLTKAVQDSFDLLTGNYNAAISSAINAVKGELVGTDYRTIKALSDAVYTLANNTAVEADFVSLLNVLKGRGSLLSVKEAEDLQSKPTDPLHILLTNYRLSDSATNILALSPSGDVVKNAKAVLIQDVLVDAVETTSEITSGVDAAKLVALGVDLANSKYNVSGDVASLVAYGTFPAQVLANATDIHATGTATFTQAQTLLGVQNRGTTTIVEVKVSYAQAASLPVDENEVIVSLTVTGLDLSKKETIVDLTGFHVSTAITFTGGRGNETVVVTAAAITPIPSDVGKIKLDGGMGSDDFYIIDAVNGNGNGVASYLVTGSAIIGGDGENIDTLTVRGQVDLSGVDIEGIEELILEEGSPSSVVLNPGQLLGFWKITGAKDVDGKPVSSIAVVVADGSTSVDISGLDIEFTNVQTLRVGAGVSLKLSLTQIGALGDIVAVEGEAPGEIEPVLGELPDNVDLSHVFVDLDLSTSDFKLKDGKLTIDGVHEVKLPNLADGQTLTLDANDLEGQLVLDGDGTLLIKYDFADNNDFADDDVYNDVYRVFDLTRVTATVSFDDDSDGESVDVGFGNVLVLRPDQADEKTISNEDGNGLVAIIGDIDAGAEIDLRYISAELTFSGDGGDAPPAINLAAGAELSLNAPQADGQSFTGNGTIRVYGGKGSDTLVWDSTSRNQMVITNFFANGDNDQKDVLDFSKLLLNNLNNTNGLTYQGLNSVTDVPDHLTADIVGLTDLFAGDSPNSVETLFNSSGNFLNNLVDQDETDGKTSMVFLIANSAEANADTNVWLWNDNSDDGNVQESELTRLGTIKALGKENLTTENFSDNVVGEAQGFAPMSMIGGFITEDLPTVNVSDTVHIMG